jgi:hypothetical protein
MRDGTLEGPEMGPGRAPAGARRVWQDSLLSHQAWRAGRTGRTHRPNTHGPSPHAPDGSGWDAARDLKVGLDSARDALRAERLLTSAAVQALAQVTGLLREQQQQLERLDRVADGYSAALTQLTVPDSPSDM